jgi:DNA-binding transcriptional LysR family regulator
VFDALASGRLVSVLDDWSPSFAGFNLFYPGRHQLGQGLRALIDMLKEYHRIR